MTGAWDFVITRRELDRLERVRGDRDPLVIGQNDTTRAAGVVVLRARRDRDEWAVRHLAALRGVTGA